MITAMNFKNYKVSYAPPVQVKDEPHRVLDTSATEHFEINSDNYGLVETVGDLFEIESRDLTPQDAAVIAA